MATLAQLKSKADQAHGALMRVNEDLRELRDKLTALTRHRDETRERGYQLSASHRHQLEEVEGRISHLESEQRRAQEDYRAARALADQCEAHVNG